MKCFYHPQQDAVAQCKKCSRGLCHHCATNNDKLICSNCVSENVVKEKKSSIITLILFIWVFIMFISLFNGLENMSASTGDGVNISTLFKIVASYIYSCGIWGWRRLNRIHFQGIFILPIVGWIAYFVIKYGLGMMIGFFTTPFDIVSTIKEVLLNKER